MDITVKEKQMDIKSIEPFEDCDCKICHEGGVIKKNIGEYCYDCLRKYKFDYPEYIDPEQYYLFMKATLEKEFDRPENT